VPKPKQDGAVSQPRRMFFMRLPWVPATAMAAAATPAAPAAAANAYTPSFFNAAEWGFLVAACERLIPADATGPGAVEAGVPEFVDRHMRTPYASGDIWYMQGPFIEAPREFGYQGSLALRDILRTGFAAIDAACRRQHGKVFAALASAERDVVLKAAESGKLELEGIDAKTFFSYLLGEVRNGYFADPSYGGNRGMAAWKMIGYPGLRADYIDWVEVRDKAYPLPPVDLAGRRG
jgi:gluconate 2-dehydrogenase gamma chain